MKMQKIIILAVFLLCFTLKFAQSDRNFIVTGSNTLSFQGKYSVAVASFGYSTAQNLEVKLYGKLNDGTRYENRKSVSLKNSAVQNVEFDLKNQSVGNYFINVNTQNFNQTMRLNMNTKQRSIYVQTDKSVYKPGDKVQFRILILNGETKPVAAESVQVYITDANYNRIKQFDKVLCVRGVYAQELQLSEEPVIGVWGIHVMIDDKDSGFVKNFEIAEYVLPKFDVSIVTKGKITKNEDIIVKYDAKYTYGKDVVGTAVVNAQVVDDWWAPTIEKTLDNSTKTVSFNLMNDLNLYVYYTRSIRITLTFTEALTGVQRTTSSTVLVYNIPYTITMTGSDSVIRPNLPFVVSASCKDINEVPTTDIRNPITFSITYTLNEYDTSNWYYWWWQSYKNIYENRQLYLNNGIADLTLDVTSNVTSISISTNYLGAYGYFWAEVKPTESDQYISIKVPSDTISASATTQIEILSNVNINSVDYVIFGRNKIAASGQLNTLNTKSFQLNLVPTAEMIPSAKLIAFYVTTNGEIISDYKILNFDNELRNFVNIELSQNEVKPSSSVNISIKSKPLSYVGLLGVDQSVLLLRSGNDIDINMVSDEVATYLPVNQYNNDWSERITYNYYRDFSVSDSFIMTNANPEYVRPYIYPSYPTYPSYTYESSESSMFFSESMAPSSSEFFPTPELSFEPSMASSEAQSSSESNGNGIHPIVTRKEFPETWLFDCVDNTKGSGTIVRKVPDTITSWIITGFSLSYKDGLGLTKQSSKLSVFMPFFIFLNLPYSIKRGEIISIQAVIFNYMKDDYQATVTMYNEKQEFEFVENTPRSSDQDNLIKKSNATANSGNTVSFVIRALKVGYITLKIEASTSIAGDRVEQQLLVEPEGITRYINEAVLVDLRNQHTFSKLVDVVVPNEFVPDSLKIEASLIGDLLGPALDNLDNLIQMPYGCGEQNMLFFVPDIIVLDYLTSVNKLTPQTEIKLKNYMEEGYQRELTYKHYDGSFSAFGNNDPSGSTWLTAFVARSFNQASKYISIDQNVIAQALTYLQNVQNADGSFTEYGLVHHKAMQGGSSNGIGLSAYVLLTFLENEELASNYNDTITRAVNNILSHVDDVDDIYIMSVVSYTLYLAGKMSEANSLVQRLDQMAVNSEGMRHWEKSTNDYYITSLSIETTAYALLSYLKANRDTDGLLIAKWLVTQRNSFGGFESTQDTVLGLLSLSRIAAKIASNSLNIRVDFKYQNDAKSLSIDQSNSLVLQKLEFPSSLRNIEVVANGSGTALAQISYHYNIKNLKTSNIFQLNARIIDDQPYAFTIEICVGLNGMDQSNMAVLEVSAPSGYIFEAENNNNIVNSFSNIKRVEFDKINTLANIYFDYLQSESQCILMTSARIFEVAEQKPSSIVVYDYYENDYRTEILYVPNQILLCDICDSSDCSNACH
ncbi:hypothetical protein ACKWTF_005088 [Chironomus riparius]